MKTYFKKCNTCSNKDRYGNAFCAACDGGDMYKADPVLAHCEADVRNTVKCAEAALRNHSYSPKSTLPITNVIFSPPATIVFWNDGTKSVVKCENETFDPEKGLAMAIAKRALGNKGNYFETFKKWVDPYLENEKKQIEAKKKEIDEYFAKRWSIWFRTYDVETGEVNGEGVYSRHIREEATPLVWLKMSTATPKTSSIL